jgi:putative endonuclease
MSDRRKRLGRWGEALACQYLADLGYTIVDQNVRTKYGEIDIIACQPDGTLVFIEVKTRNSTVFGPPEISVNAVKKAHLLASIQSYLVDHPEIIAGYRLDVIAIQSGADNLPPEIIHFENAIS